MCWALGQADRPKASTIKTPAHRPNADDFGQGFKLTRWQGRHTLTGRMPVGKTIIYAVVGLIIFFVVFIVKYTTIGSHPVEYSPTARAYAAELFIVTGLKAYRIEYGSFPKGSTAQITAALSGKNLQHMVFIEPSEQFIRVVDGQIIDPWGTPFSITVPTETNVVVRSAGWDKIFGTADDIASDQPSP